MPSANGCCSSAVSRLHSYLFGVLCLVCLCVLQTPRRRPLAPLPTALLPSLAVSRHWATLCPACASATANKAQADPTTAPGHNALVGSFQLSSALRGFRPLFSSFFLLVFSLPSSHLLPQPADPADPPEPAEQEPRRERGRVKDDCDTERRSTWVLTVHIPPA